MAQSHKLPNNLPGALRAAAAAALVVLAACSAESPSRPAPPAPPPAAPLEAASAPPAAATAAAQPLPYEQDRAEMRADARQKSAARATLREAMVAPPRPMLLQDREVYEHLAQNPVQRVAESPVSTFGIDVDTGSYSNVRRFLRQGQLPPHDAVRVEELVNYFDYRYDMPRDAATPFGVVTEMAPTPWNARTRLLHVGIQGWQPQGPRAAANLVFLVDTSGSMSSPDKLPLVIASLKLLTQQLRAQDRISLVTYAGSTGVVLEPTAGDQKAKIATALDRLEARGGTNGGAGIELAYAMAKQGYIQGGANRVLLATDGDFNVGVTSFDRLIERVEEQRKSGVALTTLGFGAGNYNEQLMERLADAGNGNYAYIDTLAEVQKVLVRQAGATLTTIAQDVKIQIEFNPAQVSEYRLIGYENRMLRREDFANDRIDAGEIGAGHRVTALYEIALVGEGGERIEPLRYGDTKRADTVQGGELAHLRLRYKRPADGMDASSRLIERPLYRRDVLASVAAASDAFRFSAAVAAFGQLLSGAEYTQGFDYTAVAGLARSARGSDPNGEAGEFLQLVQLAQGLSVQQVGASGKPDDTGG